ncbi:MAG: LamB/YcsF family protein [Hyphomicrobiales bacterium]|nr:LamB/YcsF family protein [Hyphomicrobiales bacterium]
MSSVDLNADLGEAYGCWRLGDDAAMMEVVTSANIACGGHAGDPETMFQTTQKARENKVVIGAHPGFDDKQGFGRRRLPLTVGEIERLVATQISALMGAAALARATVAYVKLHGALANWAAEDEGIAQANVNAIRAVSPDLAVLAISGSAFDLCSRRNGLRTYSEIFADRAYDERGLLVSRSKPNAMITDENAVVERLLAFFQTGKMQTADRGAVSLRADSICIHGDTPNAHLTALSLRQALEKGGVTITPFVN